MLYMRIYFCMQRIIRLYVMIFNKLLSNRVATIFIYSFIALNICGQTHFVPKYRPNPWKDDYRSLSAMQNYRSWGTYNVHDPACKKIGKYYYMYSTDAIYGENRVEAAKHNVPLGYIQVRRSTDLVHWDFLGWAFKKIPQEAVNWVYSQANGEGAVNIWAPYIIPYKNVFRLYYCVSAFGKNTSYIGMAESKNPEGPWQLKGCVVSTGNGDLMNAIDPSVIEDPKTGRWWMHYGSYFGGLYCVEINPKTGLTLKDGDKGHLTARRADYKKDNLEAPEILYAPETGKYYLFDSYDPLMTTYNVRVGRSDKAEGPFVDFNGLQVKDTTNNLPILTAPYRFQNHMGWAGTGHCGIIEDGKGGYYMAHQGRLAPENQLMVLHVRKLFFTPDGWPIVSPQRYAGVKERKFKKEDLIGEWEIIRLREPELRKELEAGQILWGEGALKNGEQAVSTLFTIQPDGKLIDGEWGFDEKKQALSIKVKGETIKYLRIHSGQDWENERETILFTGLDINGCSVWGKRVK